MFPRLMFRFCYNTKHLFLQEKSCKNLHVAFQALDGPLGARSERKICEAFCFIRMREGQLSQSCTHTGPGNATEV